MQISNKIDFNQSISVPLKAPIPSSLSQSVYVYNSHVSAGFPSPADDYAEAKLNLHDHVVKHPAATFFMKAASNKMNHRGIHLGDILVIDRSLSPKKGNIIIATLNGKLEMIEISSCHSRAILSSHLSDESLVWGVITHVLHAV